MELGLHVVSLHPLVPALLKRLFLAHEDLRTRLAPPSSATLDTVMQSRHPGLFVVDTTSPPLELARLCRILRINCPGSRFLALLHPLRSSDEEMIRMLYQGIEGFVVMSEQAPEEIVPAVRAVLEGKPWVPRHVLQSYMRQTRVILDQQIRPDLPLTAREQQVFQMMIRRFSNKEIAAAIGVSLRTVKFHVSNILSKLGVDSRHNLLHSLDSVGLPAEGPPNWVANLAHT